MLMVGSLGMVASTLPVQWLLPSVGWCAIFVGLALLLCLAMALIGWQIPPKTPARTALGEPLSPEGQAPGAAQTHGGYTISERNPYFRSLMPLGFFNFGGLVAMQTLWAAPWMVNVAGHTPLQAAVGLFWINMAMLVAFGLWGLANPWLQRAGFTANRLIALGVPVSLLVMAVLVWVADALGPYSALVWWFFVSGLPLPHWRSLP
jgi:hypothetical protein